MKQKFLILAVLSLILSLFLAACSNNSKDHGNMDSKRKSGTMDHSKMSDMNMNHSGSGEVQKGLKEATNPKYPVGSKATMNADHMPGMKGAEATIVGAYNTTAYEVTYTPTTGGEKVPNHKWVIQEEIKAAGNKTLKPGTEVTLEADHMKGMKGAKGTIDSAEKTTVYMVDYTPTNGGEKVTNHKWVTESELLAK